MFDVFYHRGTISSDFIDYFYILLKILFSFQMKKREKIGNIAKFGRLKKLMSDWESTAPN